MSFLAALRAGTLGVRFEVPPHLKTLEEHDSVAALLDAQASQWNLFFFRDAQLDLSDAGWPSLQRDVRNHADCLFDMMRRKLQADAGADAPLPPRPVRHPLISCERVAIDGGTALSVLHRMVMQPGLEIVMGHLLVPCADGLFEARWVTRSETTGYRESVLLMKALDLETTTTQQALPGGVSPDVEQRPRTDRTEDEINELMRSIDYDAPKYDVDFPGHPLTVARNCGRAIQTECRLSILRPTAPIPVGEDSLPSLRIAFVPPPRFSRSAETAEIILYERYSLAGNDGTQRLGIERAPEGTDLVAVARNVTRALGVEPGTARRVGHLVVCDSVNELEETRVVVTAASLGNGELLLLELATTTSFSLDDIERELAEAGRTARLLPKPWWRFW